jgi:peptidoglycan hydrolase-like protein with peptidoglycan-binding domain
MAFTTIKRGDYNDQSKEVQRLLNLSGIKTDTDGLYSDATYGAVSEFQSRHGLNVTGDVDELTWNELSKYNKPANGAPAAPEKDTPKVEAPPATVVTPGEGGGNGAPAAPEKETPKNETPTAEADPQKNAAYPTGEKFTYGDFSYGDFTHGPYVESELVKQAEAALNAQLANKPGEYQSAWQTQLNDAINKIMNREKFSYDMNGDALYQQYKDKFIQQGKMAMQDTMGQAAAMTGGYGNSYAATVGNQAYQQSLQNLNDVIPELYKMAYDRYDREGQALLDQYALLGEQENRDYGRHQDKVAAWQSERDYLADRYNAERDYDYGKYQDDRNFEYSKYGDARDFAYGVYSDNKNYAYNEHRNEIESAQRQAEFEEAVRQYNEQMDYQKAQDLKAEDRWKTEMDAETARDRIEAEQWEVDKALAGVTVDKDGKVTVEKTENAAPSLEHVATMSSSEIVENLQNYSDLKDDKGLATFLDDLVETGRITPEMADEYYEKYKSLTGKKGTEGETGTYVAPNGVQPVNLK